MQVIIFKIILFSIFVSEKYLLKSVVSKSMMTKVGLSKEDTAVNKGLGIASGILSMSSACSLKLISIKDNKTHALWY